MGGRESIAQGSKRHSRMTLDPRLSEIAGLLGACENYADIGCDHGRLGAFMLKSGMCQRAQLTDISEDSLKKARRLIALLGLEDRVDFCVGDGALALGYAPQAAVIAGMGGATIAHILREGRERLGAAQLVLQPNVAAPELRETLSELDYEICDERIVQDGRWLYVIIAASPGHMALTPMEREVGPVLMRDKPASLKPYAAFRVRVAEKALKGARAGGDNEQAAALERELSIWEEVLGCL